jgi:hypothetical protein
LCKPFQKEKKYWKKENRQVREGKYIEIKGR